MDIFDVFMIIAIILSILFSITNFGVMDSKRTKIVYCCVLGCLLFLIGALKNKSVGFDTLAYANQYTHFVNIGFDDVYGMVHQSFNKEYGYYFFVKFLTLFSDDYQFLFAVVSAAYAFSVSRLIYRYSVDFLSSYIMLISMAIFLVTLSGLRQTLALAISFFAYDYIIKRKLFKFVIVVLIAATFHVTVLFFLPAYFMFYYRVNATNILLYVLIAIGGTYVIKDLIGFVQQFTYEGYAITEFGETTGGFGALCIYLVILLVSFLYRVNLKRSMPYFELFFTLLVVATIIQLVILRACNMLKNKGITDYKVIFTMTGTENKLAMDLKRYAERNELPIVFAGAMSRQEVYKQYATSTLIFPSYIESFGLPLLEAKLTDAPIIAADTVFAREILDGYENVMYCDNNDIKSWESKMLCFINKHCG